MLLRMVVALILVAGFGGASAQALTMEKKAALFQHDMEARFLLDGQALCKLKLPTPSRDFVAYNMPDNAYMTGIYVGTLSMKYAVTGALEDLAAARKSLEALHLLCNVSGAPGVLARAAWPVDLPMEDDGVWRPSVCSNYKWRGDVSTDQVDGVMFGFALAHDLIADAAAKEKIARDVKAIVEHVIAHDMRIVDVDGKPTQWGRYHPKYVSAWERMNSLLWLQLLKVAAHVTGDEKYEALYREWAIDKRYAELAVEARRDLNPLVKGAVNHSDDVLLHLAYVPLLMYEKDMEIRRLLAQSIERSWNGARYPGVKPEANPFYAYVMAYFMKDASGVEDATNTLRCFPLDMKWNRDTIANYEKAFHFTFDATPKSREPEPGKPVPIDRRVKDWSAWVQNPYHSAGTREKDSPLEFNGHDYLLGYWMGRYYRLIQAAE
ncbi:MAG TPA: hypothetical protein ENN29_10040 [Candidatus Hydrogenedentes bacterium]|nr:hypothetical protein [Candidatus Hydrogenedentota bacterium]